MSNAGKRIRKAREGVARTKLYPLDEAVNLVKSNASAKFDETVELAINLDVDPPPVVPTDERHAVPAALDQ